MQFGEIKIVSLRRIRDQSERWKSVTMKCYYEKRLSWEAIRSHLKLFEVIRSQWKKLSNFSNYSNWIRLDFITFLPLQRCASDGCLLRTSQMRRLQRREFFLYLSGHCLPSSFVLDVISKVDLARLSLLDSLTQESRVKILEWRFSGEESSGNYHFDDKKAN